MNQTLILPFYDFPKSNAPRIENRRKYFIAKVTGENDVVIDDEASDGLLVGPGAAGPFQREFLIRGGDGSPSSSPRL